MGSSDSKPDEVGQIHPFIASNKSFNFDFLSGVAPFPSFGDPLSIQKDTQQITVITQGKNSVLAEGHPEKQLIYHGEQLIPINSEDDDHVHAQEIPTSGR